MLIKSWAPTTYVFCALYQFTFNLASASFRKEAYSNILKILQPKNWKFSDKNSDIFLISAQKHRLWVLVRAEAVLTSTHNLCFEQK